VCGVYVALFALSSIVAVDADIGTFGVARIERGIIAFKGGQAHASNSEVLDVVLPLDVDLVGCEFAGIEWTTPAQPQGMEDDVFLAPMWPGVAVILLATYLLLRLGRRRARG